MKWVHDMILLHQWNIINSTQFSIIQETLIDMKWVNGTTTPVIFNYCNKIFNNLRNQRIYEMIRNTTALVNHNEIKFTKFKEL